MANDGFIPSADDKFDIWQGQFITTVKTNPAKFGLSALDLTTALAQQTVWVAKYPAHVKAQMDAATATTAKDDARDTYEPTLRGLAQKVHGTPGMTNAIRAEAGLPDRGGARSSVGAPDTKPLPRIEGVEHYTLVIHWVDEETPLRRAKPDGVLGAQIYRYIGDQAPVDPAAFSFLGLDTATPYRDDHDPANAGKTAHYVLRWQNAKGETGPWSSVISAKIPA